MTPIVAQIESDDEKHDPKPISSTEPLAATPMGNPPNAPPAGNEDFPMVVE